MTRKQIMKALHALQYKHMGSGWNIQVAVSADHIEWEAYKGHGKGDGFKLDRIFYKMFHAGIEELWDENMAEVLKFVETELAKKGGAS